MAIPQDVDLGPLSPSDNPTVTIPFKTSNSKNKKDKPNAAYLRMEESWELPLALRQGTRFMRKGRTKWLPQEPKESNQAYNNRLKRSVCFGAFNRTVSTLAGLPFMRPVSVEGLPRELSYLETDCDGTGRDMTAFGHALLKEAIELGLTHIYIDMPSFESNLSLKDEVDYKIRPYFVHLSPENLISWATERIGGLTVLTSISIKEKHCEYDADDDEVEIEQVRKVFKDRIELWREDDRNNWFLYDTLSNNLNKIPLVTVYGNYTGFLEAMPPLEDLAWLNLKHYQKQSDIDNIEHVANVPILFGSGFETSEMEGIEIGASRAIFGPEGSVLSYVEHSGQATGGSRTSLQNLEEQMAAMGADLIVRKSVDRQTATARMMDSSESVSMLQIMINNLETALEQAVGIAGEWVDITNIDNLQIEIGDSMKTGKESPNYGDILTKFLIDNKGMTLDQAVYELRRRGIVADNFVLNKEVEGDTPPADIVVKPQDTPAIDQPAQEEPEANKP